MEVMMFGAICVLVYVTYLTVTAYGLIGLLALLLISAILGWTTAFIQTLKRVRTEGTSKTPVLEAFLRTVMEIGG